MADKHTLLCQCTSFRCNESRTSDNQTGCYLNRRTFNLHQKEEELANIRARGARAKEEERKGLEKFDAKISDAVDSLPFERLSLHPAAAQPLPTTGSDALSRTRKLLFILQEIEDGLKIISDDITEIGRAPADPEDQLIAASMRRLEIAQQKLNEKFDQLHPVEKSKVSSVVTVYRDVFTQYDDLNRLYDETLQSWDDALKRRLADSSLAASKLDTSSHFIPGFQNVAPFLQVVILMITVCYVTLRLPRRGTYWLFEMCEFLVNIIAAAAPGIMTALKPKFPRDIRSSMKSLSLVGESTVLAACPKCHTLYHGLQMEEGDELEDSVIPIYPKQCSAVRYGTKCDEALTRPKSVGERRFAIEVPIRPIVYFDFLDWLGGLLSREGFEQKAQEAWQKMGTPSNAGMEDIFQGNVVRDFMGPDGKTHFSASGDGNAARLLFSLSVDFFNPLGNRQAGKKISVGMVTIACLNLPIQERHKSENLYVYLIPGPHEPPVDIDGLNPHMTPIVDAFLQLWNGVYFSRTAEYLYGRVVLCAIILVICDLPMARKIGGFTASSHEWFCSRCHCRRSMETYKDYYHQLWLPRTDLECREHAEKYRDATLTSDAKVVKDLVDATGIRWTELLRLPYYKPSSYLAVDPMHNLFLGLLKEHYRNLLGFVPDHKRTKGEQKISGLVINIPYARDNPEPDKKTNMKDVQWLKKWVRAPLEFDVKNVVELEEAVKKLQRKSRPALKYIAQGLGCQNILPVPKTKYTTADYARDIVTWRTRQHESLDLWQPGYVLTDDEIDEIVADMEYVIKPSWVTSVPISSGSKLKADEWRTLGCLQLPISLMRLWAGRPDRKEFLDLTMSLVSAILVATSRVTSNDHRARYLKHMAAYQAQLQRLFPLYDCVPNHHMAFHIADFLVLYGPVHGWWTFPFERAIGQIQRLSTNYKKNEYEETMLRSWHRASNLKGLFYKQACPEIVKKCHSFFLKLIQPAARGSSTSLEGGAFGSVESKEDVFATFLDPEESQVEIAVAEKEKLEALPTEVMIALQEAQPQYTIPSKATVKSQIYHLTRSFTTYERHHGNGSVILKGNPSPFNIVHIITFSASDGRGKNLTGTWILGVHCKPSLSRDPFAAFSSFGASLWRVDTELLLKAVSINDIEAHGARVEWDDNLVVVPLGRVLP